MIIIGITFISGKYHATPWGSHVNEGNLEWPPSPYRLLRAIIASWKYNLNEIEGSVVYNIIKKLSSKHPRFFLPNISSGHTRHYMPESSIAKEKISTNMIIDTFISINKRDTVYLIWNDVDMEDSLKTEFEKILKHIHYFGRTESWCDVKLCNDVRKPNCFPLEDNKQDTNDVSKQDWEIVKVMTPASNITLENLYTTTDNLRKEEGKVRPNGASETLYVIEHQPDLILTSRVEPKRVQIVRYAIASTVNPQNTDTLSVAEVFRKAAQSQFGKYNDNKSSDILSGKNSDGKILSGHTHAFYIPTDENLDGRIDHINVVVWGKTNLEIPTKVLDSLLKIKNLHSTYHLTYPIRLVIEGYGNIEDYRHLPILDKAKRWRSHTPLVLSRHIKYKEKGKDQKITESPEEQIKRELKERYNVSNVKNPYRGYEKKNEIWILSI